MDSKARGAGKSEASGSTPSHSVHLMLDRELWDAVFALLGFGLALALWSPSVFIPHLGMGNIYSVPW